MHHGSPLFWVLGEPPKVCVRLCHAWGDLGPFGTKVGPVFYYESVKRKGCSPVVLFSDHAALLQVVQDGRRQLSDLRRTQLSSRDGRTLHRLSHCFLDLPWVELCALDAVG